MTGQELKDFLKEQGVTINGFLNYVNLKHKHWDTLFSPRVIENEIVEPYITPCQMGMNNISLMTEYQKEQYGLTRKNKAKQSKNKIETQIEIEEEKEIEVEEVQDTSISQKWKELKQDLSTIELIELLKLANDDLKTLEQAIGQIRG